MNNINIDYFVHFSTAGVSGKQKATREKVQALKNIGVKVNFYSTNKKLFTLFDLFVAEFSYIIKALFTKQDFIIARSQLMFGTKLISIIKKVPIYYEVHADKLDENQIIHKGKKLKKFLDDLLAKFQIIFYKNSDGIIFNNELLEEHFKKNYINSSKVKTVTIPNGADINNFYLDSINPPNSISQKVFSSKVCLFVGSISEWHGVSFLIDAFNILKNKDKNIFLVIAGHGVRNELEKLKERSRSENIIFTGRVSTDEARRLMNFSSICLLPVNNIRVSPGSPLKLYDYLATGSRVITQLNTPGYSDIVENSSSSSSCDFANAENLADKILNTINLTWDRKSVRNYCELNFSWDRRMSDWLKFIRENS